MEGTFFYQHDHASSTPMIIPTEENQVNIEEFMRADLFDSPPPYCDLFEAIAPYFFDSPPPSSDQASNTVIDIMSDSSSSMVYNGSQIGVNDYSRNSKRIRAKNGSSHSSSCLTSLEAKDSNGKGRKKQKREEKEKKMKEEMKAKLKAQPEGYIHVRARRGQATDSHSLAERVRRKKLSERMTMLQSLVPGCDQVNGKAQVLDVMINYVQSLQNQVEFLSMKLASMDQCMLSEYSFDPVGMGTMNHEEVSCGELEQHKMGAMNHEEVSQDVDIATLGQFGEPEQGIFNQVN